MSNYRVVIRGIQPGHSVEGVALSLARFSKKAPEKLQSLLSGGKDVLAKRTPDMQPALRYKQMLEKMGCACHIVAEITGPTDSDTSNGITSLTSFTTSHVGAGAPVRDFRYQKAPIGLQLQELMRLLRLKALIGTAVLGSAVYFGWANFIMR